MTQTEATTAHRNNCFALYRSLANQPTPTTVRARNAHQRKIDAAHSDYTFACGDVERAVRAQLKPLGASERLVMDLARL